MDPITEMLTQIKNASLARKKSLKVPYSKLKIAILIILKTNGYIADFKEMADKNFKKIEIEPSSIMLKIQRVSRPGRRVYTVSSQIPKTRTPRGLFILSTSEGLMSGEEARKKGIGGEILAEII
ncbi:MAG: 30S ribosomal protein S8 [Patescibacteria group bacterium]|jgi:small subunit ribosomal protein S8